MAKERAKRPDRDGTHRKTFERNKRKIYATQNICGICGSPVDMTLRYPNPWAKCIDHIIPIDRGGHPSDMENLQLAHWQCNRQKSNKIAGESKRKAQVMTNRCLPQSTDWKKYHS